MISLSITSLYLSLLGLLYIVLAFRTIKMRYRFKTGIGDGGHEPLSQAIRVHGNFSEYTPITMLLLACAEINGSPVMLLHSVGAAFFVGRVLHSIGITKSIGPTNFRFIGMMLSFLSIAVLALENIRLFVWG